MAGSSASGRAANSPNTSFKTIGGFTPLATRMNAVPPGFTTRIAVPSGRAAYRRWRRNGPRWACRSPTPAGSGRPRSPAWSPTSRETSSSLQPIASSGAIAPIRTCSIAEAPSRHRRRCSRSSALRVLNTPTPSFERIDHVAADAPRAGTVRTRRGSPRTRRSGSRTRPWVRRRSRRRRRGERVIHRVSPATTTVDSRPSSVRAFARTSAGNPPEIQAR